MPENGSWTSVAMSPRAQSSPRSRCRDSSWRSGTGVACIAAYAACTGRIKVSPEQQALLYLQLAQP